MLYTSLTNSNRSNFSAPASFVPMFCFLDSFSMSGLVMWSFEEAWERFWRRCVDSGGAAECGGSMFLLKSAELFNTTK